MIPVRELWRSEHESRARERTLRETLVTIESYCRTFAQRRKLAVEIQGFVYEVVPELQTERPFRDRC